MAVCDGLARTVTPSSFVFCGPGGQRARFSFNSSGAMSFVLSHDPASRPMTSSPARASGRQATPPAAPRPMITTLVFFRVAGISDFAFVEHAVIVGGFAARLRLHIHALEIGGHRDAGAGITDQIPSDEVFIAAVKGIGERSLNRMR